MYFFRVSNIVDNIVIAGCALITIWIVCTFETNRQLFIRFLDFNLKSNSTRVQLVKCKRSLYYKVTSNSIRNTHRKENCEYKQDLSEKNGGIKLESLLEFRVFFCIFISIDKKRIKRID